MRGSGGCSGLGHRSVERRLGTKLVADALRLQASAAPIAAALRRPDARNATLVTLTRVLAAAVGGAAGVVLLTELAGAVVGFRAGGPRRARLAARAEHR